MSSTPHLSALALDALVLDALPRADRERAEAHLAACEPCRTQVRALRGLQAQLPPRAMTRTLDVVHHRERWRSLAGLARIAIAPVVLAAALLVIVVRLRAPVTATGELAIKGGPAFQIYALRDHTVFAVADGTPLVRGDEIRFAVTPAGATHVLIASLDGGGHVTIYFPYHGERSEPVEPASRTELPGSIVLDDAPGPERVVAVFSTSPVAAAEVAAELGKLAAAGPARLRAPLAVPGTQVSVVFEKVPGSP
jgi:anti-sigma factor RsiW